MRRKGGGSVQSNQPSTGIYPSRESMTPHSNRANLFVHERIRTILLTSLVWSLILAISLFSTIRSYSSTECSQNNIIKSKICLMEN